jgi:predicted 3-demethylubiquinone-9 3-methyltransferase (glyoxalase superfamily)
MQKIIPHLWFDKNAEEAAEFYTSIFRKGKIGETTRYTDAGFDVHGMPAGTVLTVEFEIEDYKFVAINGGPLFKFTPAISFTVACSTKEEVDELWAKLSKGGEPLMPLDKYPFSEWYGWIKDKFGLTWQIILMPDAKRCIVPSLMYVGDMAGKAEEAMNLYMKTFKNSKEGQVHRYPAGMAPDKEGTIMYADFYIENQKFSVMDSAHEHEFSFTEAVSLMVLCKDQKEIDYFWEKLNRDPNEGQCGWIHDKFGVSWQITPEGMAEMLNSSDKEASDRAMEAMLEMKKIDIAAMKKAAKGK